MHFPAISPALVIGLLMADSAAASACRPRQSSASVSSVSSVSSAPSVSPSPSSASSASSVSSVSSASPSTSPSPSAAPDVCVTDNILVNGDFSSASAGVPADWTLDSSGVSIVCVAAGCTAPNGKCCDIASYSATGGYGRISQDLTGLHVGKPYAFQADMIVPDKPGTLECSLVGIDPATGESSSSSVTLTDQKSTSWTLSTGVLYPVASSMTFECSFTTTNGPVSEAGIASIVLSRVC